MLFHRIPDAYAIVQARGLFKQLELYHWNDRVFAKVSGGYTRVTKHGLGIPKHTMEHLDIPTMRGLPEYDRQGRLTTGGIRLTAS